MNSSAVTLAAAVLLAGCGEKAAAPAPARNKKRLGVICGFPIQLNIQKASMLFSWRTVQKLFAPLLWGRSMEMESPSIAKSNSGDMSHQAADNS